MRRKISVFLAVVLALTAFVSASAYADLERGSGGEEVASLQMMLFDMGYLFEEPDGQFGARTEAAVKEYQEAAGLEETGVVTDELMARICQDWADFQNWIYEQMELDAQMEPDAQYVPFCYTWETEDGQTLFEYCEKHALLWDATYSILMGGDAESAEYSYLEWQAEVISLYNEWISRVSGPAQAEIEVNKSLAIQLMEAQMKAMRSSYDANGTEIDPTDVYYGAEIWMRAHCAWLCQMLSTLESEL